MKHKFNLIILLAVFFVGIFSFTNFAYADNVGLDWVKSVGGVGDENVNRHSLGIDNSGNLYFTGYFNGTVDFDPGAGTYNLTSSGYDIFVLKLDSSGDFVWAKKIGGTGTDAGNGIALDSSNNVYITGYFNDTVDFDPGAGTANLVSAGLKDIFVLKLDSSGDFVWAKSTGTANNDYGSAITTDSSGNVYTTGLFVGTADFDPGAGTTNISSGASEGVFIQKLDIDGNFVLAKSFEGDTWGNWVQDIFVDSSGNIHTTGTLRGTTDYDPGAGTANLTSVGSYDGFISKLDSSGDFVWAKSIGGNAVDFPNTINVDSSGNVYVAFGNNSTDAVDYDPGAGTSNLTSNGSGDVFILKLDSSGDFVWVKQVGGTSNESPLTLYVTSDAVYVTGVFNDTVDFDPGAGISNLTSNGSGDIFVLKLNLSGDFVWAKGMGGTGTEEGYTVKVDSSNNVYVLGPYQDTVDFDPSSATTNLTSAGSTDIFILKLTPIIASTLTTSTSQDTTRSNTTLNGSITATGYEPNTTRGFQYGTTTSYGSSTTESGSFTAGSYQATLTNLQCSTTYHYRAYSSNSEATGYGSDATFNTNNCISTSGSSLSSRISNLVSMGKTQQAKDLANTFNTTTVIPQSNTFISPSDNQPKSCPGFNQYFKYGSKNDEIKLWQSFLNKEVNTNLSVDGNFGPATRRAVIAFQDKYKTDILTPWKLTKGTGYIYQSTRFKANELIGCAKESLTLDNGVTVKN